MIVTDIEYVANIKVFIQEAQKSGVRVIATASPNFVNEVSEEFFGISFTIPPLQERLEDAKVLAQQFLSEVETILGQSVSLDLSKFEMDLTKNAISLKRQILVRSLFADIGEDDIMGLMQEYLYDRLGGSDDYKTFLHLYEAPLIKAGLKRFGSQLQLAQVLGLNRNTLRKKISQNKEYLDG